MTTFVEIPGHPDYLATDQGDVISLRSGVPHVLRQHEDRFGYLHVCLRVPGRRNNKRFSVHRLILLAFRGEPFGPDIQCRHLDGNKKNNTLPNLSWGTGKENYADRVRHGWRQHGASNLNHRFSPDRIAEVKQLRRSGLSQDGIALVTGVSQTHVSRILRGVVWAEVS